MPKTDFTILIDSRERKPFDFGPDVPTIPGSLQAGDYAIAGLEDLTAVERKSLPDLAACIGPERERFKRELLRLRSYDCRAVIVEAELSDVLLHRYRSQVAPAAVVGSVASWTVRYGIPFVFAGRHGAMFTLALFRNFWRQQAERARPFIIAQRPPEAIPANSGAITGKAISSIAGHRNAQHVATIEATGPKVLSENFSARGGKDLCTVSAYEQSKRSFRFGLRARK